jgi:hypothetical protein
VVIVMVAVGVVVNENLGLAFFCPVLGSSGHLVASELRNGRMALFRRLEDVGGRVRSHDHW